MKRYKAQEELPENDFVEPELFEEEPPQEEIEDSPLNSVFPDGYVEPLRGLLFLGCLENEVFFGGHSFLLKTLTEGELLRVGQLCKPYMGTLAELESRRLYVVAAAVQYVDGEEIVSAYKHGEDLLYEKAQEIKRWYPPVIAYLFEEYLALEQTASDVASALKKS